MDHLAAANLLDERLPGVLTAWLNANVMTAPLEDDFPLDFIASNGKLALDALDTMCGKKVPGRVKKFLGPASEHWRELSAQYAAVLLFLKEKGALLNTVLPKDLLGPEDYVRACEAEVAVEAAGSGVRLSATQLREKRAQWQESYPATSVSAWTALVLQAVRTLVLARITPKAFAALPGVLMAGVGKGKPAEDPELVKSNVYSVAEGLLLKWASYHVNATTPSSALPKRITDFDGAWADGAILCHLLHSHQPSLVEGEPEDQGRPGAPTPVLAGYSMVTAPFDELRDPKTHRANYDKATAAMESLNVGLSLPLGLAVEKPLPAAGLLFALHLYMFLPQLVPKATIDFGATLGSRTTKSIELKNPSPKPVRYVGRLEGSSDFSLPKVDVTVPPKGKADFLVALEPRFSRQVRRASGSCTPLAHVFIIPRRGVFFLL